MIRPILRTVAMLAFAASLSGCFTTWVGIRAAGYPGAPEEGAREERVPLPGISERLVVALPLDRVTPSGFNFECKADQHARDALYRSGYRYGKRWRTSTVIMFVAEAALGSVLLLATKPDEPMAMRNYALGGFFAADAVGTGALALFAPRKELYTRTEVAVTTPVRSVCPDGIMVEIGGDSFPLDAAGQLGELGDAALAQWMQQPTGSLVVTFAGRSAVIDVSDVDRCAFQRGRDATRGVLCTGVPRTLAAVIDIPAGTLAPQTLATAP